MVILKPYKNKATYSLKTNVIKIHQKANMVWELSILSLCIKKFILIF